MALSTSLTGADWNIIAVHDRKKRKKGGKKHERLLFYDLGVINFLVLNCSLANRGIKNRKIKSNRLRRYTFRKYQQKRKIDYT